MSELYDALRSYGRSDIYPFHMPGHKRNPEFLDFGEAVRMDITEIDGFDNMHHPTGIIDAAQARAARLYGADETWFLVNGSSCGLIAAILGCCERGGTVVMARNCHKSVYNAVEMGGLEPVYVYPPGVTPLGIYGSVSPESVRRTLKVHPKAQAVVITSPTYEGVVSDIAGIAQAAHEFGVPLIVDEAHGAHFGFSPWFPETSVRLGADVIVQSAHKTLPSLTQTSLIHLNGTLADRAKIRKYYDFLQTTSPSYLMMASLDHCMVLLEGCGRSGVFRDCEYTEKSNYKYSEDYFEHFHHMLTEFGRKCAGFDNIRLLSQDSVDHDRIFDLDMSKIVIYHRTVGACGKWLYGILLNRYHLQMEMASRDYVLGMTSFCDRQEGFDRLYEALAELDGADLPEFKTYGTAAFEASFAADFELCEVPEICCGRAVQMPSAAVPYAQAVGRISAEYAYVYPPGVPFLVPGERITQTHMDLMRSCSETGLEIEGLSDPALRTFRVLTAS